MPRERTKLTRRQKREVRKQHSAFKAPADSFHLLDITTEEFCELQQTDITLQETWAAVREKKLLGGNFFLRDDILYREWHPPGQMGMMEQLVLPNNAELK